MEAEITSSSSQPVQPQAGRWEGLLSVHLLPAPLLTGNLFGVHHPDCVMESQLCPEDGGLTSTRFRSGLSLGMLWWKAMGTSFGWALWDEDGC